MPIAIRQRIPRILKLQEFAVEGEEGFADLLRRAKALEPEAVERLWKICGPAVLSAIYRRTGRQTARFGASDVAQAVWLSFFRNTAKLPPVETLDDLIKYLQAAAENKVRMEYRKHVKTQSRSIDNEVAIDAETTPEVAQVTATASQFAMGREAFERLLNAPPEHRQVALMVMEGRSQLEIAEELGVHVRTVQRILGRLKKFLDV